MYFNIMMNSNRRRIFRVCLIMMIYNINIKVSSVELMNDNDTDILLKLKNDLILKQELIFDGSGAIMELSTPRTLTSGEIISFDSTETSTLVASIISSGSPAIVETFPMTISTIDLVPFTKDHTALPDFSTKETDQSTSIGSTSSATTVQTETETTSEIITMLSSSISMTSIQSSQSFSTDRDILLSTNTFTMQTMLSDQSSSFQTTVPCLPFSLIDFTSESTAIMSDRKETDTLFQTTSDDQQTSMEWSTTPTDAISVTPDPCAYMSSSEIFAVNTKTESSTSTSEHSQTSIKSSVVPYSLPTIRTDPTSRQPSPSSLVFKTDPTKQTVLVSESSSSVAYSSSSTSISTISEQPASVQTSTTSATMISTSNAIFDTIIITSYSPTTTISTTTVSSSATAIAPTTDLVTSEFTEAATVTTLIITSTQISTDTVTLMLPSQPAGATITAETSTEISLFTVTSSTSVPFSYTTPQMTFISISDISETAMTGSSGAESIRSTNTDTTSVITIARSSTTMISTEDSTITITDFVNTTEMPADISMTTVQSSVSTSDSSTATLTTDTTSIAISNASVTVTTATSVAISIINDGPTTKIGNIISSNYNIITNTPSTESSIITSIATSTTTSAPTTTTITSIPTDATSISIPTDTTSTSTPTDTTITSIPTITISTTSTSTPTDTIITSIPTTTTSTTSTSIPTDATSTSTPTDTTITSIPTITTSTTSTSTPTDTTITSIPTVTISTTSTSIPTDATSTSTPTDTTITSIPTVTASTTSTSISATTTTTTTTSTPTDTIITSISTTTTITTSTSTLTTTTTYDPSTCGNDTHIVSDGKCVTKVSAKKRAVGILLGNLTNVTVLAEALSLYINSITDMNIESDPNDSLRPQKVDEIVGKLSGSINITTTECFIMAQQLKQEENRTVFGASFRRGTGGKIVNNIKDEINNSSITSGALISNQSLIGVTSLNMLIIDKPITYKKLNDSDNTKLASSIIVVTAQRNNSTSNSPHISLYFQVLNESRPNYNPSYSCSYYDMVTSKWNNANCTKPEYNEPFKRYECSCNHLSTFALVWSKNISTCNTTTEIDYNNGTCILKAVVQKETVDILRRNSTNSNDTADALSLYISSITNSNTSFNSTNILSIAEIDLYLTRIENVSLTKNTNDSFLMVQQLNQGDSDIVLGAAFTRGIGGEIVRSTNKDNVINLELSTAAIISKESLTGVTSLNMLIIDDPTTYKNIDNSTNKTIASSIIVTSVRRNNSPSNQINISLYFQVLKEWKPNTTDVTYFCSFYDTNNRRWNESGCTQPQFNIQFDRYECSCNHLTSFALLFLPNVPHTRYLDAQDIASLVFQSISILCFLFIIMHAIVIRFRDPLMGLRAYDLLPLISYASTTILFIFYIALGMTVYTKTSSLDQTQCFLSSSVLMFFVYFFLIFMFCTKTSVGYFNYLRFVRLFPEPSYRKLVIMLIISFSISIAWVAFAAGFNSHSSLKITQLIPYKLCWFSLDVIYYFLTIPVCLFLLINIILFILVAIRIINHARNATSPHQSYERMKRSALVLLSSCLTQGIGWLFGVFLTFVNPTAGKVLGWIFIVFNGLEGLWVIILYIIIRSQHMDERKRVTAYRDLKKSTSSSSIKSKKNRKYGLKHTITSRFQITKRDSQKQWRVFNDLHTIETEDRITSTC